MTSCSNSSSFSLSSSSLSSYSSDYGRDDVVDSCKKISFHSLPARFPPAEPPGAAGPPLETPASVPFRWEEAPGRPRFQNDAKRDKNDSPDNMCLELPPRLLHVRTRHHGRITDMPSPRTVLDGPDDAGRSLTYGVTFRSFRSPERLARRDRAGYFGSSRWVGNVRKSAVAGNGNESEGNSDFSPLVFDGAATTNGVGGDSGGGKGDCEVKMTKSKKGTKSHLWESIYGSLKQVVPWKRRERSRK